MGFDWDKNSQRCYAHFSHSNLETQIPNNAIDLYVKSCGNIFVGIQLLSMQPEVKNNQ